MLGTSGAGNVVAQQVVNTGLSYEDNPAHLGPPIVEWPITDCPGVVRVSGYEPGATVRIFSGGPSNEIHMEPGAGGDGFSVALSLMPSEVITATQETAAALSVPSASVTVSPVASIYPNGLDTPSLRPMPMYECGRWWSSWQPVGASLLVTSELPDMMGGYQPADTWFNATTWRPAHGSWPQAMIVDQRVTADFTMCGLVAPTSQQLTQLAPLEPLPPLAVEQPVAGGRAVRITGAVPGATLDLFLNGNYWADDVAQSAEYIVDFTHTFGDTDTFSVEQRLCMSAQTVAGTPVLECASAPAPRLASAKAGDRILEVTQYVPGAQIRIYDGNSIEIGDGPPPRIGLSRALLGGETVVVTQTIGTCQSAMAWEHLVELVERADTICPWGSLDCQRCAEDVVGSFSGITYDEHLGFPIAGNEGASLPPIPTTVPEDEEVEQNRHWQSLARLSFVTNDTFLPDERWLVWSRSGDDEVPETGLYFVHMNGANFGAAPWSTGGGELTYYYDFNPASGSLNHFGGLQTAGSVLGVSVETNAQWTMPAEVRFYSIENPAAVVELNRLTLDGSRGEANQTMSRSNATAIARLQDGTYLIFVGSSGNTGWFYQSNQTKIDSATTWQFLQDWDASTSSGVSGNWFNYQNMNLISECGTGDLFVIGLGEDSGDSVAGLYRVITTPGTPSPLIDLEWNAGRQFFEEDCGTATTAHGEYAANVYVDDTGELHVYIGGGFITSDDEMCFAQWSPQ